MYKMYEDETSASGSGALNRSNTSCTSATKDLFLFTIINSFPAFVCLLLLVPPSITLRKKAWSRACRRLLHGFEVYFIFGYAATCSSLLVRKHLGVTLCQSGVIYNLMTGSCLYLWLCLSAYLLQILYSLLPPENRFNGKKSRRCAIALEIFVQVFTFMFMFSGTAFEFMYIFHKHTHIILLKSISYDYIFEVYLVFGFFANVFLFAVVCLIAVVGLLGVKAVREQLKDFNTLKRFRFLIFFLIKLPINLVTPLTFFN